MGKPFEKDEVAVFKAFLYILPLAALAFFTYNFYWVNTAEFATGIIAATDGKKSIGGTGSTTVYTSIVEYSVADGQSFTTKENWPSTIFKYDVGDTVKVYYFEDDPKNILLGYTTSLTEISVITTFIWLFLLWYYLFKLERAPEETD